MTALKFSQIQYGLFILYYSYTYGYEYMDIRTLSTRVHVCGACRHPVRGGVLPEPDAADEEDAAAAEASVHEA